MAPQRRPADPRAVQCRRAGAGERHQSGAGRSESERAARTEAEWLAAEAARRQRQAEEDARAARLQHEAAEHPQTGLTPEEIRKAEELANWEFIKDRQNTGDLRDHLARFAGGGTERYARAKLEALVWADPSTLASIEALRTFVNEFPKGDHAETAKARLETSLKTNTSSHMPGATARRRGVSAKLPLTSYARRPPP